MRRLRCVVPALTVAAIVVACSGGCYEHVVRADGYGTESMDIYEPAYDAEKTVYGGTQRQNIKKSEPTKPVIKPPS